MNQTAPVWQIAVELPDRSCIEAFGEAIGFDDAVVTAREIDDGPRWRLTGYCAAEPDRVALETRIAIAAASADVDPPDIVIEEIPATDWVAEYQARTGPVTIGGFFIFPSHFREAVPAGLSGIRLDAGNAFGTGEHESTAGCLMALEAMKDKEIAIDRALDMGCGSAILAIAMARLWPDAVIVAVDNDPDSVQTAVDNVADNGCARTVNVARSDGYDGAAVRSEAPYDLIAANILARPLIDMASEAAAALATGGHIILSGILAEQATDVQAAYQSAGFAQVDRFDLGKWTTLVMRRGN